MDDREKFAWMVAESKKLTAAIAIPDSTIPDIYTAPSDWEFILKIDALLEAAVRMVVKANLVGTKRMDQAKIEAFIDTLAMRGRTSLLSLLDAAGCDKTEMALIDAVRLLRNGFAHDIVQVQKSLIEVIKARKDKTQLLKSLCYIQEYDEAKLIKMYEEDGQFLRFSIIHGALVFLVVAYHGALKEA
ncbi:hypothetical protein [Bosea sp. AS-1]|uniref:hypothetical protein n=1 Tax=Bosea sp. AS-1 TaxID=2015316 RepID=UPI000B76D2BA|nr:hypothetical protein [Bosea sp. AS-1]